MFRLASWVVLLPLVLVCSCANLPRHLSTNSVSSTSLATKAAPPALRVNINTASANDLKALPGVGKVLAARIVAHREQYGSFRRVEHLMIVRGFSDNKFRALRDLVTVE